MSDELNQAPSLQSRGQPPSRAAVLARLAVGAISYGLELLDTQVSGTPAAKGDQGFPSQEVAILPVGEDGQPSDATVSTRLVSTGSVSIRAAQVKLPAATPGSKSQANMDLQNTLVGAMIASARGVDQATRRLDRATRLAGRIMDPLVSPLANSAVFRPLRNTWQGWVARGQQEVDSWKQIGEEESVRGQALLENVTMSTVNASIDYITVQPKVTSLVTHQTTTLTYEAQTAFREVLFNLDIILEGALRKSLRMNPRSEIPAPPRAVRERGVTGFIYYQAKPDIDAPGSWAGYYAGFASRTARLLIDLTLLAIVMAFVAFFAQQVFDIMQAGLKWWGLDTRLANLNPGSDPVIRVLVSSTTFYLSFIFYHSIAWTIFGATVGDALVGLRVVTHQAKLPNLLRSFLRVGVGYMLSFLLLGFGFLTVLWTPRRSGLHDGLFRTYKVYSWDAHPTDRLFKRWLEKYSLIEQPGSNIAK